MTLSGGRSLTDGVAFATDRCVATARRTDGTVVCELRWFSNPVLRWINFKKKFRFLPHLLTTLVSPWIGLEKPRSRLIFVDILTGICLAMSFHIESMLVAAAISMLVVGLGIKLIIMYDGLKAYHATEHMAFNAYVFAGSTDIETIQRQDRFNPVCGTSLIAPLALA